MTEKAQLYFNKFIRHGFNHTDFTEESIQGREVLIFPELLAIEHKLPDQLRGQKKLILLARELSEIAVAVQGFAIHYFKLSPLMGMVVQNTQRIVTNRIFDHARHNSTSALTIDSETDRSIVFLRNMLLGKDCKNKISQAHMNLVIGQNQILVPRDIKYRFVRTLLFCLESQKRVKRWDACEQKKSLRNELFYLVEQRVCQYIQAGLPDRNEHGGPSSKVTTPVAAIVLLAAGYIRTVGHYKSGKPQKDHWSFADNSNKTPKYYSYHEILNMQGTHAKGKGAIEIRSFDLPLN